MLYTVPHIINGKEVTTGNQTLDIYNPSLGQVSGKLQVADQKTIDFAINSANHAFPDWAFRPAVDRANILFRYKALLDRNKEVLAKLVHQEHGKTLEEAIGSVQRGIDVVDFACAIPNHLKGEYSHQVSNAIDVYSMRQPLGVCVGITPFNFPAMIPLWMMPMAIACGNTFILKPSEKNPSCSNKLVELAMQAGVPDGVVNVIHGDKTVVEELIKHPIVRAVSFVGSSVVAEHVYKTSINHNKRAQAFGGAKNHCIVMPDADLDQAAKAIVLSAYGSAGERCMALSVIVTVGDHIADDLIKLMTPKIEAMKFGIDLGPLITQAHWERVKTYVELGKKEGAKLIINKSDHKPEDKLSGFYMGPCLFDHVMPTMKIYQEEIFGPVLCIVRARTFEEAVDLISAHPYGNGTAIFTRDGYTARTFADRVQVGMVGINVPIPVPVAYHSFGGWKNSIFSDIGMYGDEAVRFYTKLKTVTQRFTSKG